MASYKPFTPDDKFWEELKRVLIKKYINFNKNLNDTEKQIRDFVFKNKIPSEENYFIRKNKDLLIKKIENNEDEFIDEEQLYNDIFKNLKIPKSYLSDEDWKNLEFVEREFFLSFAKNIPLINIKQSHYDNHFKPENYLPEKKIYCKSKAELFNGCIFNI